MSSRPHDIPAAEPRANIGKLLGNPYSVIVRTVDEGLAAAGFPEVRPAHATVFQVIDATGSRVTDLAARAGMTKQAMTELVTHLERHGHVERIPDPTDGRARLVVLTERGWRCIAAARAIISRTEAEWSDRIGARRMAEIRRGLEALDDALGLDPGWPRTGSGGP